MGQKCPEKKDVKIDALATSGGKKTEEDKIVSVQCLLEKGHSGQHKGTIDSKGGNLRYVWNTVKEAK